MVENEGDGRRVCDWYEEVEAWEGVLSAQCQ